MRVCETACLCVIYSLFCFLLIRLIGYFVYFHIKLVWFSGTQFPVVYDYLLCIYI